MVFYRKYRRTGNRYARRGRSGYSMYKLYKSRSSGAQARQIYGLNKKMKRIQRLTKPEINIAPLVQGQLNSDEGGTLTNSVRIFAVKLTNLVPSVATPTATEQAIEGRFARIQNITMKGVFTYGDPSEADAQRMLGYMRIVLFQTKATRGTGLGIEDVFSTTIAGSASNTTDVSYSALDGYSMIRAPLKYGLARVAKVLSDKTYTISDTRQAINVKTKLKYVRNWYKSPGDAVPKGDIWMYVMLYNQQGTTANVSRNLFNYVSKCVYTDA